MKHIISLGAGVQSSTMALMAAAGEITPMPDAAIFADTQNEPSSVYTWLDWLEKRLPFPVRRVSKGNLRKKALSQATVGLPVYTRNEKGEQGKIRNRNCTRDFKLVPLKQEERVIAGIKRGQKEIGVVCWIGISADEVYRMKPSREPWAEHRFPLVEIGLSRADCLRWMEAHGFPKPPRSACVFCPFHNDAEWKRLRDEEPAEFAAAAEFERQLQESKVNGTFRTVPYLHRSIVPLDQVKFAVSEPDANLNLFNNECEGMCGV